MPSVAQQAPAGTPNQKAAMPDFGDFNQYPGLIPELGKLAEKIQHDTELPPDRTQSRLLPLLPASTNVYVAIPNYGEVARHVLADFQQELKTSPVLQDWWTHSKVATQGPKIENAIEQLTYLSEFLGDEIVIAGNIEEKSPHLLLVAEIRKPGLKEAVPAALKTLDPRPNPALQIFEPRDLSTNPVKPLSGLPVLIRSDYVVAATDVDTLRTFNNLLDHPNHDFPSTPFGQHILESYAGGISTVGALNLEALLTLIKSANPQGGAVVSQLGFANAKYLVWHHRTFAGHTLSESELSFDGLRQGIPAWLAAPSPLTSLEFVSPRAIMVSSLHLESPSEMFQQIAGFAAATNPMVGVQMQQAEQTLGISLKGDLFDQLGGELTLELDSFTPPKPAWKAILRVTDPDHLQRTLAKLAGATHGLMDRHVEEGVIFHTFQPANAPAPVVSYTFADGYLVAAPTSDAVREALRDHRSGNSLAKSSKYLAALPPGHSSGLSALFYQDPLAMGTLQLQQLEPGLASSFAQLSANSTPTVVGVYGDATSIREASTNSAVDAGAVLVIAAIAIPNLLRSRIAANEASAVGSMRTINTAELTYSATNSDQGFANSLAALGPDPGGSTASSTDHRGLIDGTLGCAAGSCEKSGYRFTLKAVCGFQQCQDYVALATPVSSGTGTRSFCSTSDGVIRYQLGGPLTAIPSVTECRRWQALR